MRPTVFGKQVVTRNGIVCGVNLGYNFYTEHEGGIDYTLNNINNNSVYITSNAENKSVMNKKKKDLKMAETFKHTPFYKNIILSSVDYIRREVIIDNSELKQSGKYKNIMLDNADYTLLVFGNYSVLKANRERLENKRKFSEESFLYLPDYNSDYSNNIGAMLNGITSVSSHIGVGSMSPMISGSWGQMGFLMLIRRDGLTANLADTIEDNLKNNGLSLAYGPCGLFRDRGLGLVFLNTIYNDGKDNTRNNRRAGLWR